MSTPPHNPGDLQPASPPHGHGPAPHHPRRPRSRTARIAAFVILWTFATLAVLTGALAWYSTTPAFHSRLRHAVISRLETATGGRVQIGHLSWHLAHLEFTVSDLTIHGTEGPGQVPWAHVDRLFVRLQILSFFTPKIGLNHLQADHPVFHLIVYPDGHTNQPQPKTPPTGSAKDQIFNLQIGRTLVSNGLILLNNRKIPFDLSARNLAAQFSYVPGNQHYIGTIHAEDIVTHSGDSPTLHSVFDTTLDLGRNSARIVTLQLRSGPHTTGKKTVIRLQGTLTNFADPHFDFTVKGAVDAREIRALTGISSIEAGIAQIDASGHGTRAQFSITGRAGISGGDLRKDTVLLTGVSATALAHITQDRIDVSAIRARLASGGTIRGHLSIDDWYHPANAKPSPQKAQIQAQIAGLRLDSILDMVAPMPFRRFGFNTAATGTAELHWIGSPNNLAGQVHVTLAPPAGSPQPAPSREVPATGTVDAAYNQPTGTVTIRTLQLHTPGSTIGISGSLGVYPLTRPSHIQISLLTRDLSEFDSTLSTFGLSSPGHASPIPAHIDGSAQFHGSFTGSLDDPHFQGRLQAANFDVAPHSSSPAFHSVHFDSLNATAAYSAGSLSVSQATLVQAQTAIDFSGSIHGDPLHPSRIFDPASTLQASVQISDADLASWIALLGKTYPVAGTLSLQAQLAGTLGDPQGTGRLRLIGGSAWGERYRSLSTSLAIHGSDLQATRLILSVDDGRITGTAGFNYASQSVRCNLQGEGFRLAHIPRIQSRQYPITGNLTFQAQANGTLQEPHLQASLHIRDLVLARQSTGFVDADAHTSGANLLLNLGVHLNSATLDLASQTTLSGDFQTRANVTLSHFDINPLLRTFSISQVNGSSDIAAAIVLAGPLRHPQQLSGEFSVSRFALTLQEVPLHSAGPLHALLRDGTLHLDPVHIVGPNTDLTAQGTVGLFTAPRPLHLTASGAINMALAETLDPDLSASGNVNFQVAAQGTTQAPDLTGNVKFTNVNVALQGITNGLSRMNGNLSFDQDRLDFRDVTAYTGGGLVRLGGFVTYHRGLYADLTATAHDVRIRYPQGITSTADADLRFQGTRASMLLSGHVLLTGFAVSRTVDFASLSNATSGVSLPPSPSAPSNHIRLDIHISSSPSLNFQNSFARLAGNVDLTIRGTLAQPTVLGRITVTEGTATFNGEKFQLQHGEIYFSNPIRIQPTIDITATTRVEDYNITIALQGDSSKLSPTFRSEPPLSEQDIFSLLAMGRTQEEQQIYNTEQQQAGVNSTADAILGGALNATLSSRIQKLFGGGSVRIDPTFVSGIGNATARITITEPISHQATLTYATNVNATAEQLIQGEWRITQNFSVLAVRDEAGVFSLIFRLHRRYH